MLCRGLSLVLFMKIHCDTCFAWILSTLLKTMLFYSIFNILYIIDIYYIWYYLNIGFHVSIFPIDIFSTKQLRSPSILANNDDFQLVSNLCRLNFFYLLVIIIIFFFFSHTDTFGLTENNFWTKFLYDYELKMYKQLLLL